MLTAVLLRGDRGFFCRGFLCRGFFCRDFLVAELLEYLQDLRPRKEQLPRLRFVFLNGFDELKLFRGKGIKHFALLGVPPAGGFWVLTTGYLSTAGASGPTPTPNRRPRSASEPPWSSYADKVLGVGRYLFREILDVTPFRTFFFNFLLARSRSMRYLRLDVTIKAVKV